MSCLPPARAQGCNVVDAACQSARIARAANNLTTKGFRHRACALGVADGALGLPDGSCLALLPARTELTQETMPETTDPLAAVSRDLCPRIARIQRVGGKLQQHELAVTDASFLVHVETCCSPIEMSMDAKGRVKFEPQENPPEGCITGHRTLMVQEIYRLEGDKLVLVHKVRENTY